MKPIMNRPSPKKNLLPTWFWGEIILLLILVVFDLYTLIRNWLNHQSGGEILINILPFALLVIPTFIIIRSLQKQGVDTNQHITRMLISGFLAGVLCFSYLWLRGRGIAFDPLVNFYFSIVFGSAVLNAVFALSQKKDPESPEWKVISLAFSLIVMIIIILFGFVLPRL